MGHISVFHSSILLRPLFHSISNFALPAMSSIPTASCTLVLTGKSSTEKEFAKTLKSINLPECETLFSSEINDSDHSFNASAYMNALSTCTFGRLLIYSPRLPSTHDVVSNNFEEIPLGSVCVTDIQSKGRGRSQNAWESPPGSLLFSFTLQMEDGRVVPLLQYVVSLAVVEAIKDVCTSNKSPSLEVKIKWPNDLYMNDLKVGGVLCTSTYKSRKFNISAGVGLNVDNEEPTTCLNSILRKINPSGDPLQREDILAAFFNRFEHFFEIFINKGFGSLEDMYYNAWLHGGQRVTVLNDREGKMEESVVTIQGLNASGFLMAVGEDNVMYELHPDGNSFDFFKGLIRRKIRRA